MLSDQPDSHEARLRSGTDAKHSLRGTIYSFTCLQEVPEAYSVQAPYTLALVELDGGGRVTAQLTDLDGPVQIGDPVEMVTRKLRTDGARGMIVYGYKFRPLLQN